MFVCICVCFYLFSFSWFRCILIGGGFLPIAQAERYAKAFWEKGAETFAQADWDRHVKNVEKGERKIEEINRYDTSIMTTKRRKQRTGV